MAHGNYGYPLIVQTPILKLPRIKKAGFPSIKEVVDLEKALNVVGEFGSLFGDLVNLARDTSEQNLDFHAAVAARPCWWRLDEIARLRAQGGRCEEGARTLTGALKAMGIYSGQEEVLHPGPLLGLLYGYKMRLMPLMLSVYERILQTYGSYHNNLLSGFANYNRLTYEAQAEIFKGFAAYYREVDSAQEGSKPHRLIKQRALELSQKDDRKDCTPQENWDAAKEEIAAEHLADLSSKTTERR